MPDALLHPGDSAKVLKSLDDCSVDAVVTDPPAGISFMGKSWDANKGGRDPWIEWLTGIMAECLRVLKPGGHALVWAIPRASHWTATAIERAGFEVRDVVTHHFGTGFPKSRAIGKDVDKILGAKREKVGIVPISGCGKANVEHGQQGREKYEFDKLGGPVTEDAKRWEGWGTALKPASEHWILARKPLSGTVAANVLEHDTGALNIDECRLGERDRDFDASKGRWPANAVFSEEAVEALNEQSGASISRQGTPRGSNKPGDGWGMTKTGAEYADTGGASRFFYCPKASKKDRGEGNDHPTVKNTELMRWLVRLVTPPGGTVLDPFMGSGSTGVACKVEGFGFIGIEQDSHYFDIACRRFEALAKEHYGK